MTITGFNSPSETTTMTRNPFCCEDPLEPGISAREARRRHWRNEGLTFFCPSNVDYDAVFGDLADDARCFFHMIYLKSQKGNNGRIGGVTLVTEEIYFVFGEDWEEVAETCVHSGLVNEVPYPAAGATR